MKLTRVLLLWLPVLTLFQLGCGHAGSPAKRQGARIVILGLDGADWQLIDPLIEQGRLPLFKELKGNAAWGTLRTITPSRSPIIWTSIASGKTKQKHGIDDFRSKKPNSAGKFPILNSLNIREPMLWEMLGSRKRRSVLVNWYLSFPPQPLLGVNVSDYFPLSVLGRSALRRKHLLQSVFPPERANEFEAWAEKDYGRILKKLALPDFPALYEQRATGMHYTDFPILKGFKDMVLQEGIARTTAARLIRSEEFDLFASYHKLADQAQHFAYMSFIDDAYKEKLARSVVNGKLPDAAAKEAYARVADIMCPLYQYFEQIMRDYFAAAGERETYFIIVSDHGFSFFVRDGTVRYNHVGPEKSPDGILIVRGPGVKPGKVKLARIYDIAPTVLYLLGLPLDHRMDGEPLRRLFTFHRESDYTVYKKGKARVLDTNSEADEKKLEELKALGYIN